jgi:hypothetical protein
MVHNMFLLFRRWASAAAILWAYLATVAAYRLSAVSAPGLEQVLAYPRAAQCATVEFLSRRLGVPADVR